MPAIALHFLERCQRLFKALGVWSTLASDAEPILDIRISDAGHDGKASPLFLHFDHREAAAEGEAPVPMGWIVENRLLLGRPWPVSPGAGALRRWS